MSRIGRLPVAIPAGVTVEVAEGNKVTVIKQALKQVVKQKKIMINGLNLVLLKMDTNLAI